MSSEDRKRLRIPQYRGESSRTPFVRNGQHEGDYRRGKSGFMWSHTETHHQGVRGAGGGLSDYRMEVVGQDKDPMRRIIREAIRIKDADKEVSEVAVEVENHDGGDRTEVEMVKVSLMNDKKEWFLPRIIAVQQL